MKNLEDIPKKRVFEVPDGYFESLPGKIQARISAEGRTATINPFFRYKLQYAVPLLIVLTIAGVYTYWMDGKPGDAESILATVQTEDLVTYLRDSDISTDDILENVELDNIDLEEIENEAYDLDFDTNVLEDELDPLDLDNI